MRVLLLTAAVMIAAPAVAQQCGPRGDITSALAEEYGERMAAVGVQEGGAAVLEIWFSPRSGTWTVLVTGVTGETCVAATGTDYTTMPPGPNGDGS